MSRRVSLILISVAILCLLGLAGCMHLDPLPSGPADVPLDLFVDAGGGNDAAGDGSATSPFKTISRALSYLYNKPGVDEEGLRPEPYTTLHIAPGIYNANLGEKDLSLNKVRLIGEGSSRDEVKIVTSVFAAAECEIAHLSVLGPINLSEKHEIWGAEVTRFEDIWADQVRGEHYSPRLEIRDSHIGTMILHASNDVSVINCLFIGPSGLRILGNQAMSILVADCVFEGLRNEAVLVVGDDVIISRCTITDCGGGITLGIDLGGSYLITDTTVTSCDWGLHIVGNAGGSLHTSGTVQISGNENCNFCDARDPYSGVFEIGPIQWDPPAPVGTVHGPTSSDKGANYWINSEGNSLQFQ
ncbi:right-handed parallel beta-helix repeat-containing protein [Candidatus Bipolaricaulota bacterium]|nr:right-handed parallel beta-helix repeat-containing protein [Candidatus Bipolaricaulota bacterium]